MTYQKKINLSDIIIAPFHLYFNSTRYLHQIYTSGRSGTKSSRAGIKAIFKIISKPCAVICMRKNHNKLRKTIYRECLRAIKRLGLDKDDFIITVSPMEIKCKNTGSTIYFTGSDSIDDTKGLIDENFNIELVIIDEANEFFEKGDGEDELQNIEATFIRGNDFDFTIEYYFNPPKNPKAPVMQWLEKMKKRKDCVHVHVDYRDVPTEWLGKKLVESAENLKELDEKMYNWIWLGLCTGIEDVIYYMFDENKHINKYEYEEQTLKHLGIGVDYGQMNATVFEAFGIDFYNRCVQGIDEYYHSGRESGKQKSPSEYANDFKQFVQRIEKKTSQRVLFTVIDPSARGLAEEIKRIMPNMTIVNKANGKINDVKKGIGRVQKILSFLALKLDPSQKHLIEEMYLYEWDEKSVEKGLEQPLKVNDHCQDALRYYIMAIWQYLVLLLPKMRGKEDD